MSDDTPLGSVGGAGGCRAFAGWDVNQDNPSAEPDPFGDLHKKMENDIHIYSSPAALLVMAKALEESKCTSGGTQLTKCDVST